MPIPIIVPIPITVAIYIKNPIERQLCF